MRQRVFDRDALRDIFRKIDVDGSGTMSFHEFRRMLGLLKIKMTSKALLQVWQAIDGDGSGEISIDVFQRFFIDDDSAAVVDEKEAKEDVTKRGGLGHFYANLLDNNMTGNGLDKAAAAAGRQRRRRQLRWWRRQRRRRR